MGSSSRAPCSVLLCILIGLCAFYQCSGIAANADQTAQLFVNASKASSRKIPESLFGIFFEVNFSTHYDDSPNNFSLASAIYTKVLMIVSKFLFSCFGLLVQIILCFRYFV